MAFAGDDLRVLVAQFTTAGVMSGQVQVQVFIEGNQADEFRDSLPFCTGDGECGGCTDTMASNYDPEALYDDGSCVLTPTAAPTSWHATTRRWRSTTTALACTLDACGECGGPGVDTDGDGICDDQEVPGCTDDMACNFDAEATDNDGSCQYLDACGVCGGTAVDTDGDGVATTRKCSDADDAACNFNEATEDDTSCTYPDV